MYRYSSEPFPSQMDVNVLNSTPPGLSAEIERDALIAALGAAEDHYAAALAVDEAKHKEVVAECRKIYDQEVKRRREARTRAIEIWLSEPVVVRPKILWFPAKTRPRTREEAEERAEHDHYRKFYPLHFYPPQFESENEKRLIRVRKLMQAMRNETLTHIRLSEDDLIILNIEDETNADA